MFGTTKHASHYEHLKNKWSHKHRSIHRRLWERHKEALDWLHESSKQVMAGTAASLLILAQPATTSLLAQNRAQSPEPVVEVQFDTTQSFTDELKKRLPSTVQELTPEQEASVADILTRRYKMSVAVALEGKRLNRSYGIIGAEQHLMRYPGDTIETHFASVDEARFTSSGMAPGRGAWGYFTDSSSTLSQKDIDREKYYIAVQTFLAPGWKDDVRGHYAFFKYRKMLVVNPDNGKAIVAVIGDAGPSPFTGKHLGGSPEVMAHLERVDGGARGPVLYYFINDPEDKIPLGPIQMP